MNRTLSRLLPFALCVLLSVPIYSEEKSPPDPTGAAAPLWTDADYSRFTPETFRAHAPARKIVERGSFDHALLSAAIFFASNEQRIRRGIPPLRHSPALHRAARIHSHDMVAGGFFAHDNPKNPARRTPWQRMAAEGVPGGFRSENIAKTSAGKLTYLAAADAIVAMWMKSPGHRRNLLDRRVLHLGCGVHICGCPRPHLFATQNFASELLP